MKKVPCVYIDKTAEGGGATVCKNCGRPKGWRVHRLHRDRGYKNCPGKKS